MLAGPLADRLGRKSLLLADSALFAIGSIVSAVAVDPVLLVVGRVIIGISIGADSAIATAYIAEFAPKERRGSLAIIQQWMITIGILSAYVIAVIILVVAPGSATTVGWRILLGIGFVPAIVSLLMRARMPESPRWLLEHGKEAAALKSFLKLGMEATAEQVHAEALAIVEEWRVALDGSACPRRWYVLSQLFVYNLSHDVVDSMSQQLVYGMSHDLDYRFGGEFPVAGWFR